MAAEANEHDTKIMEEDTKAVAKPRTFPHTKFCPNKCYGFKCNSGANCHLTAEFCDADACQLTLARNCFCHVCHKKAVDLTQSIEDKTLQPSIWSPK